MGEQTSEKKLYYGSKEWANWLLSYSIRVLQEKERPSGTRLLEALIHLDSLKEKGFWWQADRLQNWIHKYWNDLRPPKVADSPEREREEVL